MEYVHVERQDYVPFILQNSSDCPYFIIWKGFSALMVTERLAAEQNHGEGRGQRASALHCMAEESRSKGLSSSSIAKASRGRDKRLRKC